MVVALGLCMIRTICALFMFITLINASAGWAYESVLSPALGKAKEYIDANRPAEALKTLSAYKPSSSELPLYHQQYAKAYKLSKRGYDAITHLRLAYLYTPQGETKEKLLIERAETYAEMSFFVEAAMCFRMALTIFPESRAIERAYRGLADALYKIGEYDEARNFYEKAGASLSALAGKANSLNAMGRYHDAHIIYREIIGADSGYLQSSQETLFNIGKNFIEMGDLPVARFYLTSVTDPLLKYRAALALGRIALRESRLNDAVDHITYALQSPERTVKRQALLALSDLHMRFGKGEEAKSNLVEIRNKYPYGEDYDTALLMLFRIYKREGQNNEASSILKEIVLRPRAPAEALDEFEAFILEAKEQNRDEFLKLWKTGGHALLKPERSGSLIKIAGGLRNFGRPFIDLCTWLSRYGTGEAATQCHVFLADFYADLGDATTATRHLQQIPPKSSSDEITRIRAKVLYTSEHYQRAFDAIISLKDIASVDSLFLADLLPRIAGNRKALELYEKAVIGHPDADSQTYIHFADTLYAMGKKSEALHYYKTALSMREKGKETTQGEREWALYRITLLSSGNAYADSPGGAQKGDGIFSRFSMIGQKEANLNALAKRMY